MITIHLFLTSVLKTLARDTGYITIADLNGTQTDEEGDYAAAPDIRVSRLGSAVIISI